MPGRDDDGYDPAAVRAAFTRQLPHAVRRLGEVADLMTAKAPATPVPPDNGYDGAAFLTEFEAGMAEDFKSFEAATKNWPLPPDGD